LFALRRQVRTAREPGGFMPVPRPALQTETARSPKFLGNPWLRALLFDPDGTSALGLCCASVLPSALCTASAPATNILSGLHHTAHTLAVYASQDGSPRHHARLASGCLASFAGRAWVPAGFLRKVSVHLILLAQASLGANLVLLAMHQDPHDNYGQRNQRHVKW